MIKYILGMSLLVLATYGDDARAAQQYPSDGMFQEMAGTLAKGKVSIDLVNTSGYRDVIRFGLPRGELMYSGNAAGIGGDALGYKHPINRNLAAYAMLNFDSNADDTDILFGVSFSGGNSKFWYNVNGEMLSPGNGGDSTLTIKGGAYFSVRTSFAGRMYLAGEVILDDDAGTTDIYGALHFIANKNVNFDIGVYSSIDGGGAGGADSTFGIPVFFRLTLKF